MMTTTSNNTALWRLRPELCRDVHWLNSADDDDVLCMAVVGDSTWTVRLNGVEDQSLYSLFIENRHALDFDDWPGFWRWPGSR